MRIKISSVVAVSATVVVLAGCAGGNANPGQQNVHNAKSKPYSETCQKMHAELESLYRAGKGNSSQYASLLNTYMGRCL